MNVLVSVPLGYGMYYTVVRPIANHPQIMTISLLIYTGAMRLPWTKNP